MDELDKTDNTDNGLFQATLATMSKPLIGSIKIDATANTGTSSGNIQWPYPYSNGSISLTYPSVGAPIYDSYDNKVISKYEFEQYKEKMNNRIDKLMDIVIALLHKDVEVLKDVSDKIMKDALDKLL